MRLQSFRGVEDREIEFAPTGVTVIEGPNEVGKSTIAEALDLLIDVPDSSGKQQIKDVKPVHRDAGPFVELEAESGEYRFRYRKRYLKDRLTELEILAPAPQNLTGAAAHERAQEILARTADLDLWRALRLSQGDKIGQASLDRRGSLAAALDKAAGTVLTGEAETTLFDAVKAEYDKYWTGGGAPKVGAAAAAKDVTDAQAALAEVEGALRKLDADIVRFGELQGLIAGAEERGRDADASVTRHRAAWQRIVELRQRLETLDAQAGAAKLAADGAARAVTDRTALLEALAAAEKEAAERQAKVTAGVAALDTARERASLASAALGQAREVRDAADAEAARCQLAAQVLRAHQSLAGLLEREGSVREARAGLASASAKVASIKLDEAGLGRVRAAQLDAAKARAVLDAARPSVRLEGLSAVRVEVDGESVALRAGESVDRSVEGELSIVVPGQVAIRVAAGNGDDEAERDAAAAESAFAALLRAADAADMGAAEALVRDRAAAVAAQAEQTRRLTDLLGTDHERGQKALEARIEQARLQLADAGPVPAGDLDTLIASADGAYTAAATAAASARAAVEQAEPEERAASDRVTQLTGALQGEKTLAENAAERAVAATSLLAEARALAPDAALVAASADAARVAADAGTASAGARAELDAQGPEQVKALLDNAEAVVTGLRSQLDANRLELAAVQARLKDHGEEGLAEKRDELATRLATLTRAKEAYDRAARTRRVLYEAMRQARDEANRAYVGPLQQRVEALARIVFGPAVGVRLGEDLQVSERTLDGRTLPFSQLSVGAREQLAVISRLATGILVAPEGGVPVILDDALGWSDPGRLETMGAVLRTAGEACQVIVLTCYPDRYAAVGGATVRRLA